MKRLSSLVALGITMAVVHGASAQVARQQTIAERLGVLREGWTYASDKPEAPAKPPVVSETAPASVSGAPRPFPRIDPKDLMPRSWFGVKGRKVTPTKPAAALPATEPGAATPESPVETPTPSSAAGSARDRMLRELGRKPAIESPPIPRVASRPKPRAGSILSQGAPQIAPSRASRNARLARSIAQEVAESMAESVPERGAVTEFDPFADITPVEVAEVVSKESTPLVEIEGTTPTEQTPEVVESTPPLPDRVEAVASQADDSGSGPVRVAVKPEKQTTKLPLFIGGKYKQLGSQPTTVEATATSVATPEAPVDAGFTPQSAPAAEAFAAGPVAKPAVRSRESRDAEEEDFLLTQQMPVLVSKVAGPRTIVVGREATYRVLLANRGDTAADRVETRVSVPEWAEVATTSAQEGAVQRKTVDAAGETLLWSVGRLEPGKVLKLDVRLVARTGRPIELAVTHTHKPVDGRTLVQVQEPKLALSMLGPEEVLFGKPQTFRLTLSNPGTGVAENVSLRLTPPGDDASRSTNHDFGSLAAGEERTVEIELTAREAGQLAVTASAKADGDVSAETIKEVFCRKPELVVDWRGPADRYAGAPAVYYFRVRNPGTAVAPEVVLTARLPAGFEVIPGEGTPTPKDGRVAFQAGSLRPGDDKYFELRGVMRQAGANEIALSAADSGETRSEAITATTEVVALADLKLEVRDPKGPIATDQEVAYEVRITNRGSNDAREVKIVGLFSDGIEPHHVEGAGYEIHDGRVALDTIDRMAAGEERAFTIRARAHREGSHLFRAEVLCRDLDIKLAAEETTRFFQDEPIDVAAEGYSSGSNNGRFPR